MTITESIRRRLIDIENDLKICLDRNREDQMALLQRDIKFLVEVRSNWEQEESAQVTDNTIVKAMRQAISEFRTKNSRSDIDATCRVFAVLANDRYSVDSKFWEEYWVREKRV